MRLGIVWGMTPASALLLTLLLTPPATAPVGLQPSGRQDPASHEPASQTPAGQGLPAAARPIGRYRSGDRTVTVTTGDVALEMGFHLRRQDQGRAAAEHLVSTTLVRQAAERARLWPSRVQVDELWARLSEQLRAQGRDPMQVAVVRNSGLDVFLEDLAVQLAHEQLVRAELALGEQERVSGEMLKLWVAEQRNEVAVVDDPAELPPGTAVRVGGKDVPLLELGMLLLRTSDADERDRFLRQVVVLQRIEALARQEGLTVTQQDIDNEVAARRAMAARDPRYQGMTFEQLLESQGVTVGWLHESRVFRAQLLQKKIVARQHPREQLMAEILADRQAVLARAGPRRRLGVIFVRALEEPNPLVPRDFEAAVTHLERVRARLAEETFDNVARIESEDPRGKMRGGDVGWLQRSDDALPDAVLAAAFELPLDEVSAPLRGPDGCYLVKVLAIEPEPTDDELVMRLREQLVEQMTRQMLREARITRADGTALDPDQEPLPTERDR